MLNRIGFWALFGTLMSYLGFVFSAFALLEVRSLTLRYFTKQRLPQIQKSLEAIAKDVSAFSEMDISEARSQKFMSRIPVMVREAGKLGVSEFKPTVRKLEKAHLDFSKHVDNRSSVPSLANSSDTFWAMFNAVSELADEMGEYNKGALAAL